MHKLSYRALLHMAVLGWNGILIQRMYLTAMDEYFLNQYCGRTYGQVKPRTLSSNTYSICQNHKNVNSFAREWVLPPDRFPQKSQRQKKKSPPTSLETKTTCVGRMKLWFIYLSVPSPTRRRCSRRPCCRGWFHSSDCNANEIDRLLYLRIHIIVQFLFAPQFPFHCHNGIKQTNLIRLNLVVLSRQSVCE